MGIDTFRIATTERLRAGEARTWPTHALAELVRAAFIAVHELRSEVMRAEGPATEAVAGGGYMIPNAETALHVLAVRALQSNNPADITPPRGPHE